MSVHIGTSGWHYPHWRDLFYPPRLPSHDWLPYYADHFGCVEINNSFYRLPTQDSVEQWHDRGTLRNRDLAPDLG